MARAISRDGIIFTMLPFACASLPRTSKLQHASAVTGKVANGYLKTRDVI